MSECKTRRTKRYIVIATIILLTNLVTGLAINAFATVPSTTPWTLNAPPASSFDYHIGQYTNGTYFYESSTWQTWANSDNASYIFNTVSAFGAGKIFVAAGTYTFYNATEIRSNQLWEGAGVSTVLRLANNIPTGSAGNWINLCIFRCIDGSYAENVTIKNIQFDGNNGNNVGLILKSICS